MKKSLLAMLLAVVIVSPVFAFESELVPKVGWLFTPNVNFDLPSNATIDKDQRKDGTVSLNLDYFVKVSDTNLFVGLGTMWTNGHKFTSDCSPFENGKISYLNLYFTSKYKFDISTKELPMNIYPIIQFGYGISLSDLPDGPNIDTGAGYDDYKHKKITNGLYGAIGCGFEIKSFIIEALYGCNWGKYEQDWYEIDLIDPSKSIEEHYSINIRCTAFRINIGYKFSL